MILHTGIILAMAALFLLSPVLLCQESGSIALQQCAFAETVTEDGAVYRGTKFVSWPEGKSADVVVIDEDCTEILDGAFNGYFPYPI